MKKIKFITTLVISAMMISACGSGTPAGDLPTTSTESTEVLTEEATEGTSDVKEEATGAAGKDKAAVKYPDKEYADLIDESLLKTELVRVRETDPQSGDIVDMSVYRMKDEVVKAVTEDYGSDGRIVTEYYFKDGFTAYMKQYRTDVYCTGSEYEEADLEDKEAEYTSGIAEKAEEILEKAAKEEGKTVLYGYAGDEQGGVLKNVTVNIRNVAGDYSDETKTNDDGYYTLEVPQKEETYNLTYSYDTYLVSSINDVHIVPGIPEYSLGKVYVAPEGHNIHDTDTYLLNANAKAPDKLGKGEYQAVVTADIPVQLKVVDKKDQSYETGTGVKIDPSDSEAGYGVYVEDSSNIKKDDMAGNMGRAYVNVTIYDKSGIVAAYLVPAGRLGTIWRVCDIDPDGNISISGIMYTGSEGWD
ncbi:MAG: carboxypeptidase-like regulatory domain-containing protein [Lachnospiraceae bacterium]|nr:carboxypeptidase-like regulatory domain-containing protein [Lachnospiraceae bacterium]